MRLFTKGTKSAKIGNKKTKRGKTVVVMIMTFLFCVGGGMQAYATRF